MLDGAERTPHFYVLNALLQGFDGALELERVICHFLARLGDMGYGAEFERNCLSRNRFVVGLFVTMNFQDYFF